MSVLIIDDEPGLRSGLGKLLTLQGYRTLEAGSAAEARRVLASSEVNVVLLDLRLGPDDGRALLREIKEEEPDLPVIIITGHGDIASAVECMKAGAANYIPKPVDGALLFSVLEKERAALADRLSGDAFRESLRSTVGRPRAPSATSEMREIERVVEKVRDSDIPVLLLGETGTGKEVLARTIHYTGAYRDRPFIALNCASLNENLMESELFGHEKGAFTGAVARKIGRFELAGNGTLFLDEIGDMSLAMQAKLLRVLQERTMERVGGTRPVSVYCRLIAATNRDIDELRARGQFREDLYYRLCAVRLRLPPLRERPGDIPGLVAVFIEEANAAYGRRVRRISEPLMRRLCAHSWPGNIRQLRNVITNSVILCEGDEITDIELGWGPGAGRNGHDAAELEGDLHTIMARATARLEKSIIATALESAGGNVTKAAARLGISRKTLYEKMRRHAL
jgi:DNA-binding NtrC family response regulator